MSKQTIDLRAAAQALLTTDEPLVMTRAALDRLRAIARAESPILAPVGEGQELEPAGDRAELEPQGALGRRGSVDVRGGVAVIPLQGIITPRGSWLEALFGGGVGGLQGFRRGLREALGDDDVSAIVLDVHSPGGLLGLVPETADELRAARGTKPIVAVANTMTASAAYWIAAQADEVVATPSGFAGSIGVYLVHQDYSAFNAALGVNPTWISAGRYKTEGNPDEPLTDEAKAALQAEVDELYGVFVDDVAAGRAATAAEVRNGFGEGRVLPASRAQEARLVDRVASIDEVIRELANGGGSSSSRRRPRAERPGLPAPSASSDTPEPNASPELAEEVRARIAELSAPPTHI